MQDGTAQGKRFKLHGVTVRVDHSLGGEVIANADDETLPWVRMQNVVRMGQATPLHTGEQDAILESRHEAAVNVTVRQREPAGSRSDDDGRTACSAMVFLQTPCAGMTRIRFEGLRCPALSAPKRSPVGFFCCAAHPRPAPRVGLQRNT